MARRALVMAPVRQKRRGVISRVIIKERAFGTHRIQDPEAGGP